MASENRDWGYDRIAGALANLGREISDQTVGSVLQCRGLSPAPGKLCRPPMVSPKPGGILAVARFRGFTWGMSAKISWFSAFRGMSGNMTCADLVLPPSTLCLLGDDEVSMGNQDEPDGKIKVNEVATLKMLFRSLQF